MEENTLVKSERISIRIFQAICITIAVGLLLILVGYYFSRAAVFDYPSIFKFYSHNALDDILCPISALFIIVAGCVTYAFNRTEIIVTNLRVYGNSVFGKRVDLPIDSISAVGSCWPNGIAIATSSGRISFLMIKNRDEIHKCVSDLLIERQSKPTSTTTIKQEIPQSNADELKKYKELFDGGIITQEEFNAKKKQLLGL